MATEDRDFFAHRFTREEIEEIAGKAGGMRSIFAFGSPAFKNTGLDPEQCDDERLLELALQEPRMLRRPILVDGDRVLVGGRAVSSA